jgi:hypothetical protein
VCGTAAMIVSAAIGAGGKVAQTKLTKRPVSIA